MSRNRGVKAPSSMDLLLDAMCNVFGAVLFAAILLGGSSVAKKLAADSGTVSYQEFERVKRELKVAEDQLKAVNMEYEILQKLMPSAVEPREAVDQQLQQRYREQVGRANSLAGELENMQNTLADLRHQQQLLRRWQDDAGAFAGYLAKEEADLQQQLKNIDIEHIKLPDVSVANGQEPWWLLVTADEIFVIGSNQHVRNLQSYGGGIRINMVSYDGADYYKLHKIPGQGIKLSRFDFKAMALPENQEKTFFPGLLCEADATANCALLIRQLRRGGISCFWKIVPENGAFLRTVSGGRYEVVR